MYHRHRPLSLETSEKEVTTQGHKQTVDQEINILIQIYNKEIRVVSYTILHIISELSIKYKTKY